MENHSPHKTETELVQCWQDHPRSSAARHAAAELLERYQCRVYRWCHGYVKDHDQALDLAQDVLLTAIQKIDSLKEGARFSTWLFVITRNCCLGEMRKRKVRAQDDFDVEDLPGSEPSPEADFLDRLSEEQFLRTITETLDQTEQEAIYLRYYEKTSVDAITRILGLPGLSGARGVLQTARRKLRAALEDQDFDFNGKGGAGS